MHDKFQQLEDTFLELERKMSDPEVIANFALYQDITKHHAELKDGIAGYQRYKKLESELKTTEDLLKDPEMKDMAQEELKNLQAEFERVQQDLQLFLIPADPNDNKNAIVEIRSGTGGEEAALFGAELFRMYTRYSELKGWKIEVLSENSTGLGGLKEISFVVSGRGVYSRLKFESGAHRVQRVPETEASGRVHTSAATVAIMPEAEEVDVDINPADIRMDVFRASGAGGQHVNKTSSAVRLTHEPTGVVVACQDERSQFQNREKAMRLLRARIYDAQQEALRKEETALRKSLVGSGDRSEKIRTYNYPQNRVTDHRINVSLYNLTDFLDGKMDELLDALISADRVEKMKEG
ncbi:MAG: peptide chain release factor 1 [Candidatus Margulisiibacteriota bacterium]